jgi:hypothetical protein
MRESATGQVAPTTSPPISHGHIAIRGYIRISTTAVKFCAAWAGYTVRGVSRRKEKLPFMAFSYPRNQQTPINHQSRPAIARAHDLPEIIIEFQCRVSIDHEVLLQRITIFHTRQLEMHKRRSKRRSHATPPPRPLSSFRIPN